MILRGTDLMVFTDVAGSGTSKSIAYATNHTLTLGTASQEISTKDSGGGKWTELNIHKLNWSASSENLYSYDGKGSNYNDLFEKMLTREPVTLVFALESTYATKPDVVPAAGWTPITAPRYTGTAYITDLSLNAPDGDNASFSVTFTGSGALVLTEPSA
jgi:predicted secreted protein